MSNTTRVLLVGDMALGGDYAERFSSPSDDWSAPFADLRSLFCEADLRIGNLESPLARGQAPRPKRNCLSAPPEAARALDALGFTNLNLANNHITDQGAEALSATREILGGAGIECFGAGKNLAIASQPVFSHHHEQTFAFLGFAEADGDVGAVVAAESDAGCNPLSLERIVEALESVRSRVSHVIVSLHWGYQYDRLPSPDQIDMAHSIIDAGATIVHGHHPHVLQGVERYRDGLILYSLGNFFFSDFRRADGLHYRLPSGSRRTAAVLCDLDASGVRSHSCIPLRMTPSCRLRRSRGVQAIKVEYALSRLSKALSSSDYQRRWLAHHEKTRRSRKHHEEVIESRSRMRRSWQQARTDGWLPGLLRVRFRHFAELLRAVGRHVAALLRPLARK